MTLRMLLNMTSGLSYLEEDMEGLQKDLIWSWTRSNEEGHPWDTIRVAKELARIPLCFEPGTHFQYSLSLDVMGAVIEMVSGQNLGDYCEENIFRPLGMEETSWKLGEKNEHRLAKCYKHRDGKLICDDKHRAPVLNMMDLKNPVYYSGGAGVLSTLSDYAKFARMLLREGELDGRRIISADILREMHSPQLKTRPLKEFKELLSRGQGIMHDFYNYGYGVRTMVKMPGKSKQIMGEWGWSGAMGTWLTVDPQSGIWFVYMHQGLPSNHMAYIPNLYHAIYSSFERR